MNILQTFRYHLTTHGDCYYPQGSPCMFIEGEKWSELCHNVANTKSNRRALKNTGLSPDLIDLPLINVALGSREANSGFRNGYSRELILLPPRVILSAQETIREHIFDLAGGKSEIKRVLIMFYGEGHLDIGIGKVNAYREWFEQIVEKAICPHKKYEEVIL